MRKIFISISFLTIATALNAQIYDAISGLSTTGSGPNKKVKLGGTNPLTENADIDLGPSFYFNLKKNTSNYFTVLNGGNVGIGISPAYKLDVNGTLRTTSFLFPAGAASGKVFTSDQFGNASWQTPGGGTTTLNSTQIAFGNVSNQLSSSSEFTWDGTKLMLGNSTGVAVTTPVSINTGATFGNNTPGTPGNLKLKLYDNNSSTVYGLGISSAVMEYQVPTGADHRFYVAGTEVMRLASTQANFTVPIESNNYFKVGSLSSDPTGANGMMYYNTTINRLKAFSNSTWQSVVTSDDVQNGLTYNSSGKLVLGSNTSHGARLSDNAYIALNNGAGTNYRFSISGEPFVHYGGVVNDFTATSTMIRAGEGNGFNGNGTLFRVGHFDGNANDKSESNNTGFLTAQEILNNGWGTNGGFKGLVVRMNGSNMDNNYNLTGIEINSRHHYTNSYNVNNAAANVALRLTANSVGAQGWLKALTYAIYADSGRVYSRDSVMFGTTTPGAFFHVNGTSRFDLGGDNTGDIFYRNAAGQFTRLPIGTTNGHVLTVNNGLPVWAAASGGGGGATWGSITGTLSAQTDLQTALNAKQATLVSGTNIKTIFGSPLLGSGNLSTFYGSTGTGVNAVSLSTNAIVNAHNAAVIGGQNTVIESGAVGSVGLGADGHIYGSAWYGFVANDANEVWGESGAALNFGNDNFVSYGFVAGNDNVLGGLSPGAGSGNQYAGSWMIGSQNRATGNRNGTLGTALKNTANESILIGFGGTTQMVLNETRAIAMGANSDVPTFIVHQANGAGTYGQTEAAGTLKVGSISVDNTETKLVTWNSTDKVLEWRDASTLGGGGTNFWTQAGSDIYNNTSGNVGIGTTNTQGYRLAVNGDAIFTKVKVKQYNTWPDYVFHSPYKLMPLIDLEKYIQKNKHLPDMPSAKEVEDNGLDLGDTQATMLKKIEELTLYIIEINKKVEKLAEENAELKKKLAPKNN